MIAAGSRTPTGANQRRRPARINDARQPDELGVVLTPRSNRSSWLMRADGSPVEAWPYRLMPEYGPEGSVAPPPTKGNEVRVATIHR